MKIGEFAKACNVPVSVLRYYDSYGLLKPVYICRASEEGMIFGIYGC